MKKLIIANWKMNPSSIKDAKKLFIGIRQTASKLRNVQTVVAPPFLYLTELNKLYLGHRIKFAGQDVFWADKGSFTGEISSAMLKGVGATYVIIGHSERRALGENNEDVNKKVISVIRAGLTAILCIGESNRDHKDGTHLLFLTRQLESALDNVPKNKLSKIVVAYEPIWTIGKREEEAMRPEELHETVLFIKKTIVNLFGKKSALKVPILYGGSVERGNTEALFVEGMVDGLLIGHASLKVNEFNNILCIAQKVL